MNDQIKRLQFRIIIVNIIIIVKPERILLRLKNDQDRQQHKKTLNYVQMTHNYYKMKANKEALAVQFKTNDSHSAVPLILLSS